MPEIDVQRVANATKWTEGQWRDNYGVTLFITCRHPKCRVTKHLNCYSPTQLRYAEESVKHEVYYCARHKGLAWEKSEELSDYLLPFLDRLKKLGVCNKTKSHMKQRDIDFLLQAGLISSIPVPRGANVVYDNKLTERGEQYLEKFAARLELYYSHQAREEKWYWVPTNSIWSYLHWNL